MSKLVDVFSRAMFPHERVNNNDPKKVVGIVSGTESDRHFE
jgi:hypothetical protein